MYKKQLGRHGFHVIELVLVVVVISVLGLIGVFVFNKQKSNKETVKTNSTAETDAAAEKSWQEGDYAVKGSYADADVVDLGGGKYRLYYATQPEVQGHNFELYSAVSTDGKTWKKESGNRKTMATFPDVVKLDDNTWRMYFQNAGVIKSATSKDGLSWTDESGTRITTDNDEGLALDNVAASTTYQKEDGTWVMVYRGQIAKQYKTGVPNQQTSLFLWATSKDGLKFDKQGIALDSRDNTFEGWMDGPDFVEWDDNSMKLTFWGYKGVYESAFDNKKFSEPKLTYDAAKKSNNPNNKYPTDIPGDPTLMKIGGTWFMYYGSTGAESGIHYFTLK